jgi:outer membrane protein assembly factor BamB
VNLSEWWVPVVWPVSLSVGIDGTLFAGGPMWTIGGGSAVAFALTDNGSDASYAWADMVDVDRNEGSMVYGLALREENDQTTRVYVNSGHTFAASQSYGDGGSLVALDAWDGTKRWEFDPDAVGASGSFNGIAIGSDGVVYTSVTGTTDKGRVFALKPDGSVLWGYEAKGLLEWSHPVIGPQGRLYFGESRRCALAGISPIEDGLCAGVDIDPALYVITDGSDSEDTGVDIPDDTADTGELIDTKPEPDDQVDKKGFCGCATSDSGAGGALIALLLVARRRS